MCLLVKEGLSDDVGFYLTVVPIMHCWKGGGAVKYVLAVTHLT